VLWAAGVSASPAAKWLGACADNAGRLKMNADLSVRRLSNVLVQATRHWPILGMASRCQDSLLPRSKAVEYVAKVIRARIEGRSAPGIRLQTPRQPAYDRRQGRGRRLSARSSSAERSPGGFGDSSTSVSACAWNRISVMFDWFCSYLPLQSGTRLITGSDAALRRESATANGASVKQAAGL
jgi:NADH:ubiquinone reductase (H+-translocating)